MKRGKSRSRRALRSATSLALMISVSSSLLVNPGRAETDSQSVQAEDAAIFELLRGDAISSKIKLFCVNSQLLPVGEDAAGRFAKPINNERSAETDRFLRDLKKVASRTSKFPARAIEEKSLRGAGFRIREASFDECSENPTVRINRPMTNQSVAVVFATLITKCGAVPLGVNFQLRKKAWERRHIAHYYPVSGPPGCSKNSKVVPGEATDKLFILER